MDTHSLQFKTRLGLFIIGGLAIMVLAIFIIGKQKNLFDPVFKLTTTFRNVSGLQVGNNVRFSGIIVGTVDNISIINDSTVRVDMLVKKSVKQFVKSDCEVAIGSEGIIGDRLLIITQGSNDAPLAKEGQYIGSKEPVETDDIIASLNVTAGSVEIITNELAEIMSKVNSGHGTLGRLIHDTKTAQDISQTINNFKITSDQIEKIMVDINNGEGLIGKIIQDQTIAQNLSETMENLKNSSLGLNETIKAAQNNILFRGYFNKKKKEEEKKGIGSSKTGLDTESILKKDNVDTKRVLTNDNDSEELLVEDKDGTKKVLVKEDDDTEISLIRDNVTDSERLMTEENEDSERALIKGIKEMSTGSPAEMDAIMSSLQITTKNTEVISKQLIDITKQMNSGKGTFGMLINDTTLAKYIKQTIVNLKGSSKGLDENMEAAKHNFLFKKYFEKKAKNAQKKKDEAVMLQEVEVKK